MLIRPISLFKPNMYQSNLQNNSKVSFGEMEGEMYAPPLDFITRKYNALRQNLNHKATYDDDIDLGYELDRLREAEIIERKIYNKKTNT